MKAYKCPKCGYLDIPEGLYGACYINCPECDTLMLGAESVDVIDWEKELLTKTDNHV